MKKTKPETTGAKHLPPEVFAVAADYDDDGGGAAGGGDAKEKAIVLRSR